MNLIEDKNCDRPLEVGVHVMSQPIEFDSTRTLKIFAGDKEIHNNTIVSSDMELLVKFEPKIFSVLYELRGSNAAVFVDGDCKNKRITSNGAKIKLSNPLEGQETLTIVGIWAKSHSGGVKIADPIDLIVKGDSKEL